MDDDDVRRIYLERCQARHPRRRETPRKPRDVPIPPGVLERVQAILDRRRAPDPDIEALRHHCELLALMMPDAPAPASTRRRRR